MNKNTLQLHIVLLATLLMVAGLTQYCKKIEYEQLKRPYSDVQHFAIAGYGDLDSVAAVISDDNIILYWNANAERPQKIKPIIAVSPGASISPASDEEVDFSENTVYTVTAEDGTTKEYKLKPIFNVAVPVIFSSPANYAWASAAPLVILGEYFFAAGDASNIKVYGKRVSDGFEFDIPVDLELTTKTSVVANLPLFDNHLDIGEHEIYVKVGEFASNYVPINLLCPSLYNNHLYMLRSVTVEQPDQPLKLGDSLTIINDIHGLTPEMFEKYYPKTNITRLQLFLYDNEYNYEDVLVSSSDFSVSGNKIKIYLGSDFEHLVGYYVNTIAISRGSTPCGSGLSFEYPAIGAHNTVIHDATGNIPGNSYETGGTATLQFAHEGEDIRTGQILRVNRTFSSQAIKNDYLGNIENVRLVVRQITGTQAYFRDVDVNISSDDDEYFTFSVPTYYGSQVNNTAVVGITVTYYSNSSPTKYLRSTVILPELNTKFVTN